MHPRSNTYHVLLYQANHPVPCSNSPCELEVTPSAPSGSIDEDLLDELGSFGFGSLLLLPRVAERERIRWGSGEREAGVDERSRSSLNGAMDSNYSFRQDDLLALLTEGSCKSKREEGRRMRSKIEERNPE